MIDTVTITNLDTASETSVTISLRKPETSGYYIKSIDGLGPVKANIITSDSPLKDGSYFNSARGEDRNLVIHLGFLWSSNYEIEQLREQTYVFAPYKANVRITVKKENGSEYYVEGYVESNEPDIFSKDEGCDISIICPDVYWKSSTEYSSIFSTGSGSFEFPFSNESLTSNLIEFGEPSNVGKAIVNYASTQPYGMLIRVLVEGYIDQIRISNPDFNEITVINYDFQPRDTIEINTIQGKKSVNLLRRGNMTNILGAWDRNSDWITLHPGKNRIYLYPSKMVYWDNDLTKSGKLFNGYTNGELHYNYIYEGI